MHWNFKTEYPYFVLDPEGDGMTYFATKQERDDYAEKCIKNYLDSDGWDDLVAHVVAGKIDSSAQRYDVEERPPETEIDEDGLDQEGRYWDPDTKYLCKYRMTALDA